MKFIIILVHRDLLPHVGPCINEPRRYDVQFVQPVNESHSLSLKNTGYYTKHQL
jgi:hypothetical protein